MNLIRLNTPEYFALEEETDLNEYLENKRELYYVLIFDGDIVGCGGINFVKNGRLRKLVGTFFIRNISGDHSGHSFLDIGSISLRLSKVFGK